MNRFDWKSGLIGILLALALAFGVGSASQNKGGDTEKKSETATVGRFQIVAAGDNRGVTVLVLDTATGQVWFDDHAPPGDVGKDFLAPKLKKEK
jgi:hypothetical protein